MVYMSGLAHVHVEPSHFHFFSCLCLAQTRRNVTLESDGVSVSLMLQRFGKTPLLSELPVNLVNRRRLKQQSKLLQDLPQLVFELLKFQLTSWKGFLIIQLCGAFSTKTTSPNMFLILKLVQIWPWRSSGFVIKFLLLCSCSISLLCMSSVLLPGMFLTLIRILLCCLPSCIAESLCVIQALVREFVHCISVAFNLLIGRSPDWVVQSGSVILSENWS